MISIVEKELIVDDAVIKNPARAIPRPQIPYEPEYVRMNKEPIIQGDIKSISQNNIKDASFVSADDMGFDESGNEIKIGYDGHIIDNNDFVDYAAPNKTTKPKKEVAQTISAAPAINSYILMVMGKMILSGSLKDIEDKVKAIMYGEDKDFDGLSISVDDIVVLKRMNIKVGIFIQ